MCDVTSIVELKEGLRTRDAYTFENSCVVCEVSIGAIEIDREDGRTPDQLRPLACSRNILHRPHGSASWSQGDTKVLAAVYGPKPGTRKNENPEKACFEVIWKPKSGQIGKAEKEYEMIL
ncbi:unnamed protein product [Arabidopsis lyrata]|nr:unnamed protein product [Arabidopsis lyrata]